MNRSFFGLLRATLLRPSTPFFGTCFVWQQRGSRRQVGLPRPTAYARPVGAVTASHGRCDCDRSFCAPESRLWAVCREERPTGKCKSTCRWCSFTPVAVLWRRGEVVLRVHGITCAACSADFTRLSSWSGQADGPRYCHRRPCQSQGKAAGHIRERTAITVRSRAWLIERGIAHKATTRGFTPWVAVSSPRDDSGR